MPRRNPAGAGFGRLGSPFGIFGGSFDPPHAGHVAAAEDLLRRLNLRAVVFLPAAKNPLKAGPPAASPQQRLEMVRLAISQRPGLFVSDVELRRGAGPSFTVDTVELIRREAGSRAEIVLLIGSDAAEELGRWKDPERLFELCTVVPFRRGGAGLPFNPEKSGLKSELARRLIKGLIEMPEIPGSSTRVRQSLAAGQALPELISPQVAGYIAREGIYRAAD